MAQKLEQQLKDVGLRLETPPSTKDVLVKILKQSAGYLTELEQSPSASMMESMQPFLNAIVKPELLKHQDRDVKLLVATCICEITRITAPEAPYSDDVLKDIFHLIVGTFSGLSDATGPSFGRRVVILETLAKYRSCVVMLDLDCDDLVNEMFSTFLAVVSDDHPESVMSSMQTIMVVLLEESEEIREDLLYVILSVLGRSRSNITSAARRLAMNVIRNSVGKLEAGIRQFLISSMSGESKQAKGVVDYHEVIYDLYTCAPQTLAGVVPYLTGELLNDQLDTRLKAVRSVGDLFALPRSSIYEVFQPIFTEYLKRLTDRVVEVRMSVLEHVKSCLLSNPLREEAPQIISALCDRLLDFDENVRKQVVSVICDVKCHALDAVPLETVQLVAERLRDKSLLVKKYTMERLAEIYRVHCLKSHGSTNFDDFAWIPGKILRCFYDKDFRSDIIESVLCGSLFSSEFPVRDRVKHWLRIFSGFDKVEVRALEKILEQKQRLQQEMQRYLSVRQTSQDGDAPETQKKILFSFRIMSRSFSDPAKAEENFLILDQLKDANVWKILTNLVDPNTSFQQVCIFRDDLLKILGEKHRLYDFLSLLSVKCSYLLFNKDHVKEILEEVKIQKSAGNVQDTLSCMNMLVLLARFSPVLLSGSEEELINFLRGDDEIIKEGVLHVLAKAGGTIREQLAVSSSSIDLILERLCLEGSRRQAKYAVHALAAITKDDGLKSLSVLYKRLVDLLEEKTHLPAVLQSLGCIAQTAMPVFETREGEIEQFIVDKILKSNEKVEDNTQASWEDRSDLCLLKIFGLKTLVKSYLPVKDAHVRPGINNLLEILGNILSCGEISKDIESSSVDKAHLRLASAKAVLRLSKHWDDKIPVNIFHLTLKTSEMSFLQARKLFLSKVHQYIKDRVLDTKYACAFLFNVNGSYLSESHEVKQNLADIVQMHHQAKARQHSMQCDANTITAYPECIVSYVVHVLAHHSCPDIDECTDVKAFELLYRRLYFILSVLVHGDEDAKSEDTKNKEKESVQTIVSILKSIKNSEDIIDAAKSKNSHAICDLGLSIIKRLAQREDDLQGLTALVSLPSTLYKTTENKEGHDFVANENQSWLADVNVLVHFESLKLEGNDMVSAEAADHEIQKDGEGDENEMALGKMIKSLKSQGAKSKTKKRSSTKKKNAENKNAKNDVDILTMVREINLDNLGTSSKLESSNGHGHFPRKTKLDPKHLISKKRKVGDATSFSVPKRRRSLSAHSGHKLATTTSKARLPASADDSSQATVSSSESIEINKENSLDAKDKVSKKKKMAIRTDSDLLVSCLRKYPNSSSKSKRKRSATGDSDEAESEEANELDIKKPNVLAQTDNSSLKSSMGAARKQKRRSIAGLAKCTSKNVEKNIEDLIGCRIKVWWPMDKKFYGGTVKSYDPIKRKHVVLYDDGDVEVLWLERERWELIDKGRKSSKKLKSSRSPNSIERTSGQKNRNSISSLSKKKSSKKVKGSKIPKKALKQGQNGVSKNSHSEEDDRESFEVSNPEITMTSKGDEVNSGDSDGKRTGTSDNSQAYREDSDKEMKSISRGNWAEDSDEGPSFKELSDEEKPDIDELDEDDGSFPQTARNGEKTSHSENRDADKSRSTEEDHDDEAASEENQETKDEEISSHEETEQLAVKSLNTLEDEVAEISDDEPLNAWKQRVARKGSRKVW